MKRPAVDKHGPANPQQGRAVVVGLAEISEAAELAAVAAATFPLACPPSADPADVAAFIASTLSADRFAEYLADPDRAVFAARADGGIVGYAMVVDGGDSHQQDRGVELSKIYLLASRHRSGSAAALLDAGLRWAAARGAGSVWLGVNQKNQRAQRFYAKHGFTVTGTRTFALGAGVEDDFVMTRALG